MLRLVRVLLAGSACGSVKVLFAPRGNVKRVASFAPLVYRSFRQLRLLLDC
jgi:hypothetical protein